MKTHLYAALIAVLIGATVAACGAAATPERATPTPAAPPTATTAPLPEPHAAPEARLCVPTTPAAVAEGDSWTISGRVETTGPFPGSLPPGVATTSTSFQITEIGDWVEFAHEGDEIKAEDGRIVVRSVTTMLDGAGVELARKEATKVGAAAAVANLSPVLTLDWECHTRNWLQGWEEAGAAPSVERRATASGATAIVFLVELTVAETGHATPLAVQRSLGYDIQTGRLVLQEVRTSGQTGGEAYSVFISQEVEDGGASQRPAWLEELVRVYEQAPVANPPAKILSYTYRGETVYYVPAACCDMFSDLYDADGVLMGHPDGGITGNGDGQFPLFSSLRTGEVLVWEDTRK